MRLLLDSHVLIWWESDHPRIGPQLRERIGSPQSEVYVSTASIWEIAIKVRLGRLRFPVGGFAEMAARSGFDVLPIQPDHAVEAAGLPRHHDDPFDRMLIAQARLEGLTLASADAALQGYSVALISP